MIAHLPLPFVAVAAGPLLAVGVWVVLRRARRPVQVYIGEDERSMSRDLSGARRRGARGPKASAQRGLRRPAQSPPSTDCRGSAVLTRGRSTKKTPAPRVDSMGTAALPLHFRLLRRLGIECRSHEGTCGYVDIQTARAELQSIDEALNRVTTCRASSRAQRILDSFEHNELITDAVIFEHVKAEQSCRAQVQYWMGMVALQCETQARATSASSAV